MKLFDDFEAVKYPEEKLIYITNRSYIYYIYNPKYKIWRKHGNAGNDKITVNNYPDANKTKLKKAMGGIFPSKETDFMRLCNPSELCIRDMLDLLMEDYPDLMSDSAIYDSVHIFLLESVICHKSYLKLKKLFDDALAPMQDKEQVLVNIKALCLAVLGRDIFKKEIGIIDGHDGSSYFWIRPVRVIDFTDTNDWDNVAKLDSVQISIEEDDVVRYLTPFLFKHFDKDLEANKKRIEYQWTDDDGNAQITLVHGFEWYLTHNFYSLESIAEIVKDIRDTADALSSGRENEFTAKLRKKKAEAKEDETDMIIVFYRRFLYRMEYMMTIGKENGFDLISFMGP